MKFNYTVYLTVVLNKLLQINNQSVIINRVMIMYEKIKYLTIDELTNFLQEKGYSTSQPSLVKQQMYGVMMRSLPETELFEWGRDTRKRLYHPFAIYENITASRLFSGLYWHYNVHGARMVHFDVFIGRLGYYANRFSKINAVYGFEQRRVKRLNTFSFSINDVFRNLLQKSDYFIITETRKIGKNKIEVVKKRHTEFNSECDEKLIATYYQGYESFTEMFFIDNAICMNENVLVNTYNNLACAACCQLFGDRIDAERYMAYQTMMYTRTIEEVIRSYKESLNNYMNR